MQFGSLNPAYDLQRMCFNKLFNDGTPTTG